MNSLLPGNNIPTHHSQTEWPPNVSLLNYAPFNNAVRILTHMYTLFNR